MTKHQRGMEALAGAVQRARHHVEAIHVTNPTDGWEARCSCGWVSPLVHDRRTALQSFQEHRRKA